MRLVLVLIALAVSIATAATGYADLNVTKRAPLIAAPGVPFEYQCVVYNYGPIAATRPRFVDVVPVGLVLNRFCGCQTALVRATPDECSK